MKEKENSYSIAVLFIWAGALVGLSLIATPAKFLAPSLDLSVALEIGQITFSIFNKVEWFFWCLYLALSWNYHINRLFNFPTICGLLLILLLQTFWLLPILGTRIDAVINGTPMEPSYHHTLYALLEACKVLLIVAISMAKLRRELDKPC